MVLLDNLPTDSVLRRHAVAERMRALGLPPTDAVLRRHHDQLVGAVQARAAAAEAARIEAALAASLAATRAASRAAAARAARPAPAPVAAPAPSSGGGLFGWLRRLLGSN